MQKFKRFISTLVVVAVLSIGSQAFAGKSFDDTVLDAGLNVIKNNATMLVFVSAHPANYAGVAAVALVVKSGLISSDYTGPVDNASSPYGRKLAVNAVTGMTPVANGTVVEACLVNGTTTSNGTVLYGCATTTPQAVTTSQTWNSPAFNLIMADPI